MFAHLRNFYYADLSCYLIHITWNIRLFILIQWLLFSAFIFKLMKMKCWLDYNIF